MKRSILPLLALSAAILSAGSALGQNQATAKSASAAATPPAKQPKLVRLVTLNTVEENRIFQANVQLLQTQRQAVLELNAAWEKEKDAKKKKELKTQLDTVLAKLNENNQAMAKTYGFSLDRNYIMEIEKSHVYLLASDEEAAKLEKTAKEKK